MLSVEDQRQTLDSIYRLLMPGGKLIFDVFNPDPRYFVDESRVEEHEDTPETPLPNGRSFRVRGRGVTRTSGPSKGTAGDLIVTIEVQVPAALDEKARAAVQAYRDATGGGDLRANLFAATRPGRTP